MWEMDYICADDDDDDHVHDDDINDGEHMLADNFAAVEAKNLIKNQSKKNILLLYCVTKRKRNFSPK